MELANNFGLIMDSMKENGKMMFRMEEEGTQIQMGRFMMVTGKMENGMERESIKVKMDSTMESGI